MGLFNNHPKTVNQTRVDQDVVMQQAQLSGSPRLRSIAKTVAGVKAHKETYANLQEHHALHGTKHVGGEHLEGRHHQRTHKRKMENHFESSY